MTEFEAFMVGFMDGVAKCAMPLKSIQALGGLTPAMRAVNTGKAKMGWAGGKVLGKVSPTKPATPMLTGQRAAMTKVTGFSNTSAPRRLGLIAKSPAIK